MSGGEYVKRDVGIEKNTDVRCKWIGLSFGKISFIFRCAIHTNTYIVEPMYDLMMTHYGFFRVIFTKKILLRYPAVKINYYIQFIFHNFIRKNKSCHLVIHTCFCVIQRLEKQVNYTSLYVWSHLSYQHNFNENNHTQTLCVFESYMYYTSHMNTTTLLCVLHVKISSLSY